MNKDEKTNENNNIDTPNVVVINEVKNRNPIEEQTKKRKRDIIIVYSLVGIMAILIISIFVSALKKDSSYKDNKTDSKPNETIHGPKEEVVPDEEKEPEKEDEKETDKEQVEVKKCYFDGEIIQGATYIDGQYTYKYMQKASNNNDWRNINEEGWGVTLTDKNSTTAITTVPCTTINDIPIITMSHMFYNSKASKVDLSKFNTTNVTDMSNMFSISDFTSLDVTSLDTSNVIDMSHMFSGLDMKELDVSSLDTSNVEDMSGMFSITEFGSKYNLIGLDKWDTSNVEDISSMFSSAGGSANRIELDLSSWDTSNVLKMSAMFHNTGFSVNTFIVNFSNWDTSNIDTMSYAFRYAGRQATTFKLIGLDKWDTSNVSNLSEMFNEAGRDATTFSIGNISKWNTSSVSSMGYMFKKTAINADWSLDLTSWDVQKTKHHKDFNLGTEAKVKEPIWKY